MTGLYQNMHCFEVEDGIDGRGEVDLRGSQSPCSYFRNLGHAHLSSALTFHLSLTVVEHLIRRVIIRADQGYPLANSVSPIGYIALSVWPPQTWRADTVKRRIIHSSFLFRPSNYSRKDGRRRVEFSPDSCAPAPNLCILRAPNLEKDKRINTCRMW